MSAGRTRLFGIIGIAVLLYGMFLVTEGAWFGSTVMLIGAGVIALPLIRRRRPRGPRMVSVRREGPRRRR